MIKKFMDLKVGEKFSYAGINYEKIPDERISCCKVNNAKQLDQPNTKIQIVPIAEVDTELKNELQ
jgi:hypothetical protein